MLSAQNYSAACYLSSLQTLVVVVPQIPPDKCASSEGWHEQVGGVPHRGKEFSSRALAYRFLKGVDFVLAVRVGFELTESRERFNG